MKFANSARSVSRRSAERATTGAEADVEGEVRLDAAGVEVDLIEELVAVLILEIVEVQVVLELDRQAAAVADGRGRPEQRRITS